MMQNFKQYKTKTQNSKINYIVRHRFDFAETNKLKGSKNNWQLNKAHFLEKQTYPHYKKIPYWYTTEQKHRMSIYRQASERRRPLYLIENQFQPDLYWTIAN